MRGPQESSFEERLNHWISAQGIWFQLRHPAPGSAGGKLAGRLMHTTARLAVIVLLVAAVGWIYLIKRVDTDAYHRRLEAAATKAIGAESLKLDGFKRQRGTGMISRLSAEGGRGTFFHSLELEDLRFEMGLLDGMTGEWDAGPVSMSAARIEIKAGAEDEEELAAAAAALFGEHDWFKFQLIEVQDATVVWGYSERTRGAIQNSHLLVQREPDGWRLRFRGGRLSQNWLRRLEIDELVMSLHPGSLTIEQAAFHRDEGTLTAEGSVAGGVRPEFDVRIEFERLPLTPMLPVEARPFIEGSASGSGTIRGSSNSQDGLQIDCGILLGAQDQIQFKDRLPLLQALTVIDAYNSYRKVLCTIGGFRLRTGGGQMQVEDIQLEAPDLMKLSGRLGVRPPTDEEIALALAAGPDERDSSFLQSFADEAEAPADKQDDEDEVEDEFTLRRAAELAKEGEDGEGKEGGNGKEKDGGKKKEVPAGRGPAIDLGQLDVMPMSLEAQARDRHARMQRFEGGLVIEIPGDAFERAPLLKRTHLPDPASGRISLRVPLSGTLFEVTLDQAEEIYVRGRSEE